ncbi:hypothetical protein [Bradyrhizobium sp. LTSPM299]|uniref:hypothetical protein n=1 Tax=Bradyrhizobium sp. LTSPM299 TaxID=1619233 RepID=UPI0012E31084|nr:hypothetical protein [Bradyrhizobium sp. LTSPM299]
MTQAGFRALMASVKLKDAPNRMNERNDTMYDRIAWGCELNAHATEGDIPKNGHRASPHSRLNLTNVDTQILLAKLIFRETLVISSQA